MTIELLPAIGVRLPTSARQLRFGMSQSEVWRTLETHDPRAAFVHRTDWAAAFRFAGCAVGVSAADRGGLSAVSVSRLSDAHVVGPVAFLGIDLFGWPANEIVAALRAAGHPVAERSAGNMWIGDLHLSVARGANVTASARKKPRRRPPQVFDYACLYRPGATTAPDLSPRA